MKDEMIAEASKPSNANGIFKVDLTSRPEVKHYITTKVEIIFT